MPTPKVYFIGLMLLAFIGTACSEPVTSFDLVVGNPCQIQSGGTLPVTVRGNIATDATVLWEASSGGFSNETSMQTNYLAPSVQQQTAVQITVSLREGRQSMRETVECIILPPTATTEQNGSQPPIVVEVSPANTPTADTTEIPTPSVATWTPSAEAPPATPTDTPTPTPVSTPIPMHTPGAVSAAESLGQCGPAAFGDNLRTDTPRFTRPAGHVSGWVSSDAAMVILPNGTSRLFPSQFVLFVDDLAYVELQNVSLNTEGVANSWGCWYREANSVLVGEGAAVEYQKKRAYGQFSEIYRVSATGFTLFDPDVELNTIYRTIPSILATGIEWCTDIAQTVSIAYEGGAYSGWPSDDLCPAGGCWRSSVFVFLNQEVEWVNNQGAEEPGNEALRIGWSWPALHSAAEVISRSRLLSPGRLTLEANDCLRFVVQDGRNAYGDNRGDVTISISPLFP